MKKLKIAQVAPLWYPVPPKGYGGTEFIVSKLTEGLIKNGHHLTLFASGDSKTKGKLFSIIKKNLYSLKIPWLYDSYNILNLVKAFSQFKEFDIIHTHIDLYDPIFRSKCPIPTLATLHNPFWSEGKKKSGKWYDYQARVLIYNQFPHLPYVAISNSYRYQCPAKINFVKTIHHGVEINNFTFNPKPENHFVWLGRFAPNKGLHLAARLAKKLGLSLEIAGKPVSPENQQYFKKEVKPFLSKKIKYVGEIKTEKEKSDFLKRGKALLYPLLWEEPFGIVMIEAMACGTPVIAFKRGSVPEIVENKKTGFIVKNLEQMEKAIKNIDFISRLNCRKRVEENFTVEKMVKEYENIYYQLIKEYVS